MRSFEWYNLNVYHVMGIGENRVLVKIHQNTFFVIYLLISSTKSTFSLGKKFGGTRHLHVCKKNKPTLDHSAGGGVHGEACRFIAYKIKLEIVECVTVFIG